MLMKLSIAIILVGLTGIAREIVIPGPLPIIPAPTRQEIDHEMAVYRASKWYVPVVDHDDEESANEARHQSAAPVAHINIPRGPNTLTGEVP